MSRFSKSGNTMAQAHKFRDFLRAVLLRRQGRQLGCHPFGGGGGHVYSTVTVVMVGGNKWWQS